MKNMLSERKVEKNGTNRRIQIPDHIRQIILTLGEDPERPGLLKTPERVGKALEFLTSGYFQSVEDVINGAVFPAKYDEMVVVNDIEFYSLCEHHMLPFFGKCHVAYIPNQKIIGLSKIPRIVEVFSRRLQVQENLTVQIAEVIKDKLQPKGVGVIMDAQHLCLMMRGAQKQRARMTTSHMLGTFRSDHRTRVEFLELTRNRDLTER